MRQKTTLGDLLFFSSNRIPELAELNIKQRTIALADAAKKFTPWQKFVLNSLKLLILVPGCIVAARLHNSVSFAILVAMLVGYLVIIKPVYLAYCRQHLPKNATSPQ